MSTTKQKLKKRLEQKEASLLIAQATYDKLLADTNESYRFDSGEGSQSTKRVDIEKIQSQIKYLEAEIDQLCKKLSGKGLTRLVLRRNHNCRN